MHASKMVCRVCLHMFRLSQVVVFLSHFSLNKLKWVTLINWFARQKWNSFPFLSRTAQSLRENLHLTVTFYEPYVRWLLYLWHAIVNRKRIYHKKGHKTEFLRMLIDLLYTVWVCGAYQQQIRHYISMEKNKKNNKKTHIEQSGYERQKKNRCSLNRYIYALVVLSEYVKYSWCARSFNNNIELLSMVRIPFTIDKYMNM